MPALLAVAALAALPAAAPASSVSTEDVEVPAEKGSTATVTSVSWTADPGEANRLEVRPDRGSSLLLLRDEGAPIRAGAGCAARADGTVACRLGGVSLAGGDGDDQLRIDGISARADGGAGDDTVIVADDDEQSTLSGGEGDDLLLGSAGPDQLDGGAGADTISGGHGADSIVDDPPAGPYAADRIDGGPGGDWIWGVDTVVYDRPTPVTVDLRSGVGGAPGEGDRLVGVEGATGGSAADTLIGTDGRNTLAGGRGGADLIDGRGGDDTLAAADPRARLLGGAGDDRFYASAGTLRCGPGRDRVDEPRAATVIAAATCERIVSDLAFSARPLPPRGRTLELRVRTLAFLELDRCGTVVVLRSFAGGRPLVRRFVPSREGQLLRLRLVAARPLPGRVRVELLAAFCHGGRRSLTSQDRFAGRPARMRFTVTPFG